MTAYVRRINDATLRVTIGGVRIGSAKYSRLAQINLHSRIITFSRYAIEDVPERGRRYLVIHELAHVKEPSHNKRFWEIVERYEPDYKNVGRSIQQAFTKNVRQGQSARTPLQLLDPHNQESGGPKLLLSGRVNPDPAAQADLAFTQSGFSTTSPDSLETDANYFYCDEDEFGSWAAGEAGIMHGGSAADKDNCEIDDCQTLPSSAHSADLFIFGSIPNE